MTKRDPKGNVRTVGKDGSGFAANPVSGVGNCVDPHSGVATGPVANDGPSITAALSNLLMRDDGWLRVSPDGEGKTCFWKWKFSHGKFCGYYVMVVMPPWDSASAVELLQDKIERSYLGRHKPTRDRAYNYYELEEHVAGSK